MKNVCILLTIMFCSSVFSQTQTKTVTFKPDPTIAQDAAILTTNGCILNGNPATAADLNYSHYPEVLAASWSFNAIGCSSGTLRSLFRFDELSTIPKNAVVTSAELKLYGVSSSPDIGVGNSYYPGSPYNSSGSNQSSIQKITSDWDEETVTWNTQPTTTTTNQITVSKTTSQWNENFTDNSENLVAMVQEMVNDPETNFGFMIKLDTEVLYRSVLFASSNHSNPDLWPELTVTYEYESSCPCEANFSYMVNTVEPNSYFFMASNPAVTHEWTVDGVNVSNTSSFSYLFPEGNHKVCYTRDSGNNKCEKCITLCVGESRFPKKEKKRNTNVQHGRSHSSDKHGETLDKDISAESNKITVYPNPTNTEWNAEIVSNISEKITISIFDMTGKLVYSDVLEIITGKNSLKIESRNLQAGSYIAEIKGNDINFKEVLIKY